ncbi:hypothetical protein LTR56_023092 [Elasticomyces elasticus]|nr:hypothetical protein LTR56_023092 [Elasticomyces elasticus]KAK3639661.1 hypothetical protein LTR22_017334 [Elasticomyces elasticus]KAK4913439.1 hypothetical protein LTR49_018235 [Elasticomyces elasticus]KAK5760990.1 hypothetical protein LTS12_008838 [Elasticomyces elasticus]
MRLLNVYSLELEEFLESNVPEYAILSHTWTRSEVSYRDMQQIRTAKKQGGYDKIERSCHLARIDKLSYVWVDTCCIDKSSSSELQEAINSMYRWYAQAKYCYAYLVDAELSNLSQTFERSVWFLRGWCLQELIAPKEVKFFDKDWNSIGWRTTMVPWLSRITKIDVAVLNHRKALTSVSVAKRMSWAAYRKTSRVEDIAYCLLGIFDVSIPMLYGEGSKAFARLQEEIIRTSNDHSIFAWGFSDKFAGNPSQLLADSPADFVGCHNLVTWGRPGQYDLTNRGLRIELEVIQSERPLQAPMSGVHDPHEYFGVLHCRYEDELGGTLGLRLQRNQELNEYNISSDGPLDRVLPGGFHNYHPAIGRLTFIELESMAKSEGTKTIEIAKSYEPGDEVVQFWLRIGSKLPMEIVESYPDNVWNSKRTIMRVPLTDEGQEHLMFRGAVRLQSLHAPRSMSLVIGFDRAADNALELLACMVDAEEKPLETVCRMPWEVDRQLEDEVRTWKWWDTTAGRELVTTTTTQKQVMGDTLIIVDIDATHQLTLADAVELDAAVPVSDTAEDLFESAMDFAASLKSEPQLRGIFAEGLPYLRDSHTGLTVAPALRGTYHAKLTAPRVAPRDGGIFARGLPKLLKDARTATSPVDALLAFRLMSRFPALFGRNILTRVLYFAHTLPDLFNLALVSRAFYRVYKEHESDFVRAVVARQARAESSHGMSTGGTISDDDGSTVSGRYKAAIESNADEIELSTYVQTLGLYPSAMNVCVSLQAWQYADETNNALQHHLGDLSMLVMHLMGVSSLSEDAILETAYSTMATKSTRQFGPIKTAEVSDETLDGLQLLFERYEVYEEKEFVSTGQSESITYLPSFSPRWEDDESRQRLSSLLSTKMVGTVEHTHAVDIFTDLELEARARGYYANQQRLIPFEGSQGSSEPASLPHFSFHATSFPPQSESLSQQISGLKRWRGDTRVPMFAGSSGFKASIPALYWYRLLSMRWGQHHLLDSRLAVHELPAIIPSELDATEQSWPLSPMECHEEVVESLPLYGLDAWRIAEELNGHLGALFDLHVSSPASAVDQVLPGAWPVMASAQNEANLYEETPSIAYGDERHDEHRSIAPLPSETGERRGSWLHSGHWRYPDDQDDGTSYYHRSVSTRRRHHRPHSETA